MKHKHIKGTKEFFDALYNAQGPIVCHISKGKVLGVECKRDLLLFDRKFKCIAEVTENDKQESSEKVLRDAARTLLKVAASMLKDGISGDIEDWNLPKTTPKKTLRKIVEAADEWNNVNRERSIELKHVYDILQQYLQNLPKPEGSDHIAEADKMVPQRECGVCWGGGKIETDDFGNEIDCPRCDGTGIQQVY